MGVREQVVGMNLARSSLLRLAGRRSVSLDYGERVLREMLALIATSPLSWAIQPASVANIQQAASLCIDEFET